ncbi:TIGR01777 family oxidoreductase [Shewanella sp. 5_MG-2023]|uniref:TIGR01777 family oxidoreductase n=1 Tax=unclassified Shewanella TaxID=196818 RepID=UPI000C85C3C5|nr:MULTISPECIES: TIGR01777 family oxidoreductase [unclassified Shewanella]MDO6639259.1 TIGR01777 family oxidoreductase [Shewanella sp. 5_MG-2023]MDO6774909.1 TIGR01777 family oxidoreductase [Shewanella sp. 3_MG-2023]PMI01782.1 TIGR01777 family protein [Shewanella sp. 10N.286.48.A6]
MKILITGATGFVGQQLVHLLQEEHKLTIVSRNIEHAEAVLGNKHHYLSGLDTLDNLNEFDSVINLAGEPIVGKRWSQQQKQRICDSRWNITARLAQLIQQSTTPPASFISASAIGFYGRQGQEPVDEHSQAHDEFSHQVCSEWEHLALKAQSENTRVCVLRIGIVLGKNGGALAKMLPPFKLGLGGPIGKGTHGVSWIHIDDLTHLIEHLINSNDAKGIFNATAPNPVNHKQFAQSLGFTLKRPAKIPTPVLALRLAMGEMADLIVEGQFVLPKRTLASGFNFKYTHIDPALDSIFNA